MYLCVCLLYSFLLSHSIRIYTGTSLTVTHNSLSLSYSPQEPVHTLISQKQQHSAMCVSFGFPAAPAAAVGCGWRNPQRK